MRYTTRTSPLLRPSIYKNQSNLRDSLVIREVPKPTPGPKQLLVRLTAAALNHRDLFIRHHQYPAISFTAPMLADGCGTVIATGPGSTRGASLLNKPVILTPMRGWEADPAGPEDGRRFSVTGSSKLCEEVGTAQDYIVVDEDEVELAPEHLSSVQAAALPLVGLTGWRALVTKGGITGAGQNVLITGIGGGVALQMLQFAVALGANAYVSSGDQAKIDRAVSMGAKGGVIYKNDDWANDLAHQLPEDRPFLDAVIDGAGGKLVGKVVRLLKPGGVIAQYGMTVSPKMDWLMSAVLANVDLRGCTMGSKKEFRDMIAFVRKHKITPVVNKTVKGLSDLEGIDGLFADMEKGAQFGKLVIEIGEEPASKL